jgi:hypothetical protein
MFSKELFDFISKGNIEKSLYTTCIFLIENSRIEVLEETLISVCSYIGTFIGIREIAKLNEIIINTRNLIENEKVNITDYFTLITKMCIICNIYNLNPVSKTGIIPIGKLREKIIDVFSEDSKLSSNGIHKFEMIIPPPDSEAYLLSLKIITSFIRIFKLLDEIPNDDKIDMIAIKFKNCFDYIIRKKYAIETKLNPNECDPIYFLWGFIEILFKHEEFIHSYYWLFCYDYKKSLKTQRIGLIYACSISIIYSYKRHISNLWNQNELNVIYKTKEICIDLLKQVRKDLKKDEVIEPKEQKPKNKIDGITYINTYTPFLSSNKSMISNPIFMDEYKTIEK